MSSLQRRKRHISSIRKQGFVLLEVVVSLGLLAVGVVAAMGALRSSLRVVATSEAMREATVILSEQLEAAAARLPESASSSGEQGQFHWQIQLQDFSRWTDHVASAVFDDMQPTPLAFRRETMAQLEALSNMRVVHVRVEWEERGRTRFVEARQVLSNPVEENLRGP